MTFPLFLLLCLIQDLTVFCFDLILFWIFYNFYLFIYLRKGKGGRKRERETLIWERNIDWLPRIHASMRVWTCNPGKCLDWELNQRPFPLWDDTQPTELPLSGLDFLLVVIIEVFLEFLLLWGLLGKHQVPTELRRERGLSDTRAQGPVD